MKSTRRVNETSILGETYLCDNENQKVEEQCSFTDKRFSEVKLSTSCLNRFLPKDDDYDDNDDDGGGGGGVGDADNDVRVKVTPAI